MGRDPSSMKLRPKRGQERRREGLAMVDPHEALIMIDANALDGAEPMVLRFRALMQAGCIRVGVSASVAAEGLHPNTPAEVRVLLLACAIAPRSSLSHSEKLDRIRVRAILRGDAPAGRHEADAAHLSEAAEAGCGYFITNDRRILRRREALRPVLPASMAIMSLARFLERHDGAPLRDPV